MVVVSSGGFGKEVMGCAVCAGDWKESASHRVGSSARVFSGADKFLRMMSFTHRHGMYVF